MIEFKAKSWPAPTVGQAKWPNKITVPDQSMSLKEILERFVRENRNPISQDSFSSDEQDAGKMLDHGRDLEKMPYMDLVEKDDVIAEAKKIQERFQLEDRNRRKKRWDDRMKAEVDARVAERMAKQTPPEGAANVKP